MSPHHFRHHGMSLVELIIAMAVGMVILTVVSQAYLGGLQSKRANTDITRLNETSRFAFDLITRSLRKAGYSNRWGPPPPTGVVPGVVPFCGTTPALMAVNGAATIDPTAANLAGATNTVLNASDVLRVSYYGEDNAAGTAADGSVLDCHGYPVRRGQRVDEVIFVANDLATNEPSLFCYTSNPTPAIVGSHPGSLPLVTGVESMQLLFGEDVELDGVINRYVPWGLARPDGTAFSATSILSAKLSVVVRTPNAVGVDNELRTYNHFSAPGYNYPAVTNADGGAVFTPTTGAGRLRSMQGVEIALRNFCTA